MHYIRPNTKAHCVLISKCHCNRIRIKHMLPVMKNVAHRIEILYKPARYRFVIPIEKLGGQNKTHFYARFLPTPI